MANPNFDDKMKIYLAYRQIKENENSIRNQQPAQAE